MALFDCVVVLASVIIGLGVTQLLQGVAAIVQHPERKRAYWAYLIWGAFIFSNTVFWWWWQFSHHGVETWTFPLYLFVILYAVVMYINCAMLIPADMDGYGEYKDFFYSRRRWIFGSRIIFLAMDLIDTSTLRSGAPPTSRAWGSNIRCASLPGRCDHAQPALPRDRCPLEHRLSNHLGDPLFRDSQLTLGRCRSGRSSIGSRKRTSPWPHARMLEPAAPLAIRQCGPRANMHDRRGRMKACALPA